MEMYEIAIIAGIGAVVGLVAGLPSKTGRLGRIGITIIGALGGLLGGWILSLVEIDFTLGEVWMDSAASAAIGGTLLLVLVGVSRVKLK